MKELRTGLLIFTVFVFLVPVALFATNYGESRSTFMARYKAEWLERFGTDMPPDMQPHQCAVARISDNTGWKVGKTIITLGTRSIAVWACLEGFEYVSDNISRRSWYCFYGKCKSNPAAGPDDFATKKAQWEPPMPPVCVYEYISQNYYEDCVRYDNPSMSSLNRCNTPCANPPRQGEIEELHRLANQ